MCVLHVLTQSILSPGGPGAPYNNTRGNINYLNRYIYHFPCIYVDIGDFTLSWYC